MVLVPRRARRHLLLLTCCLVGCGGDVTLRLGFTLPEGPEVLATTASVNLWATRDATRIAFVTAAYAPGAAVALDDIDKEGPELRLFLTARDAEGAPTAYGELGPPATSAIADADAICCLAMCVCSVAYHEDNPCDCGSNRCAACN